MAGIVTDRRDTTNMEKQEDQTLYQANWSLGTYTGKIRPVVFNFRKFKFSGLNTRIAKGQ